MKTQQEQHIQQGFETEVDVEAALLQVAFDESITEEQVNQLLTNLSPSAMQLIDVAREIEQYNQGLARTYKKFARKLQGSGEIIKHVEFTPQNWIIPKLSVNNFDNSFEQAAIKEVFLPLLETKSASLLPLSQKLSLSNPSPDFLCELLRLATPKENFILTKYLIQLITDKVCDEIERDDQMLLAKTLVDSFLYLKNLNLNTDVFDIKESFNFVKLIKVLHARIEFLNYLREKIPLEKDKQEIICFYFLSTISLKYHEISYDFFKHYNKYLDATTIIKAIVKVHDAIHKNKAKRELEKIWKTVNYLSLFGRLEHLPLPRFDNDLFTKNEVFLFLKVAVQRSLANPHLKKNLELTKKIIVGLQEVGRWNDVQELFRERESVNNFTQLEKIYNEFQMHINPLSNDEAPSNAKNTKEEKSLQNSHKAVMAPIERDELYNKILPTVNQISDDQLHKFISDLSCTPKQVFLTGMNFGANPINNRLQQIAIKMAAKTKKTNMKTIYSQEQRNVLNQNPPAVLQIKFSNLHHHSVPDLTFLQKKKIELLQEDGETILSIFEDPQHNDRIKTQASNCLACLQSQITTKDEMIIYKNNLLHSLSLLKDVFKKNNKEYIDTFNLLEDFYKRVERVIKVGSEVAAVQEERCFTQRYK